MSKSYFSLQVLNIFARTRTSSHLVCLMQRLMESLRTPLVIYFSPILLGKDSGRSLEELMIRSYIPMAKRFVYRDVTLRDIRLTIRIDKSRPSWKHYIFASISDACNYIWSWATSDRCPCQSCSWKRYRCWRRKGPGKVQKWTMVSLMFNLRSFALILYNTSRSAVEEANKFAPTHSRVFKEVYSKSHEHRYS